jgi:hypothetical protein
MTGVRIVAFAYACEESGSEPSMHDDAPWVVAEARSCGCPSLRLIEGPTAPRCRGGQTGNGGRDR